MSALLNVLCAGAVQGLAKALEPAFVQATGATLNARYGNENYQYAQFARLSGANQPMNP